MSVAAMTTATAPRTVDARASTGPCRRAGTLRQGSANRASRPARANNGGSCVGNVEPTTRDCSSSKDNDCDGKADNTIDGVCQCSSGAMQACGAHPGKDGVGPCKAGSQSCNVATNKASSSWGACSGSVGPAAADTCALGNDNNCNGTANEGCTCTNGATKTCECGGPVTCANGSWPACPTTGTGLGCNSQTYCDSASHMCWTTSDAVNYTQDNAKLYCAGLTFQGSSDWSLPTRNEFKTVTRGCTSDLCPRVKVLAFLAAISLLKWGPAPSNFGPVILHTFGTPNRGGVGHGYPLSRLQSPLRGPLAWTLKLGFGVALTRLDSRQRTSRAEQPLSWIERRPPEP